MEKYRFQLDYFMNPKWKERYKREMYDFPYVEASFVIEGENFEPELLTGEINILPTEIRKKDDWPEAIKRNKKLPKDLWPRGVWSIYREKRFCNKISAPIYEIVQQLRGKETKIINICKNNCLKIFLIIVVHAETMDLPEMVLPSELVKYFGEFGAEIGFDVYIY